MLTSLNILSAEMQKRFCSGRFSFDFKPGINFLIGSNGAGKSTLFNLIERLELAERRGHASYVCEGEIEVRSMRMQEQGRSRDINAAGTNQAGFRHGLASHFFSHGQANWPILQAMQSLPKGCLLLIDEPEQALDFQRLLELRQLLIAQAEHSQFVIASHNPILLTIPQANIINLDVSETYLADLLAAYRQC